jgi:putative spermidine/putrescine transport system permease protein
VLAVAPATLYTFALLVVPFLFLAWLSLHDYDSATGYGNVYTIRNYLHLAQYQSYFDSLVGTAKLGVVVTVLSIVLGYPIAYFIARSRSHFVPLVTAVVVMPMFVSVVVRGFGWMVLLGREGPLNQLLVTLNVISDPVQFLYGWGAVIVSLVHVEVPLAILPIASVLRGMDAALVDAARSLGASGPRVFWTVILPLSLPGVAAGGLLVFSHAIAAFILPALLGSERIRLMSTMIYQQIMSVGNVPLGAALGVVMVVAAFALIALLKLMPTGVKA